MMAPAAFGRVRSCRFVHTETARAKPMHSKGLWRPDSEEFSAHPEPSRTPAAHARGRPASSRLLCELLDRILAGVLIVLSHLLSEDQLLLTLQEYLGFIVPGQANALVAELRIFLAHREVLGGFLLLTMLFFSALAFTVLENAMSVIFFHRVAIKRRHFLVSAVLPYLFNLFLGVGLLVITLVSSLLQFI